MLKEQSTTHTHHTHTGGKWMKRPWLSWCEFLLSLHLACCSDISLSLSLSLSFSRSLFLSHTLTLTLSHTHRVLNKQPNHKASFTLFLRTQPGPHSNPSITHSSTHTSSNKPFNHKHTHTHTHAHTHIY